MTQVPLINDRLACESCGYHSVGRLTKYQCPHCKLWFEACIACRWDKRCDHVSVERMMGLAPWYWLRKDERLFVTDYNGTEYHVLYYGKDRYAGYKGASMGVGDCVRLFDGPMTLQSALDACASDANKSGAPQVVIGHQGK